MKVTFDKEIHRRYLMTLLSGIIRVIPEKLAFKGGTCAMLFYELPRFSMDLDFDMLKALGKEEIDALRRELIHHGRVIDEYDKQYTFFFLFDYAKGHNKIKIEMNKRVWKNNVYKNVWFLGLPIAIPDEATLVTNKLVAISDRKSAVARDLFDAWFFLSRGFCLSDELIKERMGMGTREFLEGLVEFIGKTYSRRNVLQGFGDMLDEKQKGWARDHLINDVINEIRKRKK